MKKETKDLIDGLKILLQEVAKDNDMLSWLNCKGNDCMNQSIPWERKILQGEYNDALSTSPESNYNKLMALFDKLEETEKLLCSGGLVQDKNNNVLKSGDRIRFQLIQKPSEVKYGTLDYDANCMQWFIDDDDGNAWYPSRQSDEVEWFERAEEE